MGAGDTLLPSSVHLSISNTLPISPTWNNFQHFEKQVLHHICLLCLHSRLHQAVSNEVRLICLLKFEFSSLPIIIIISSFHTYPTEGFINSLQRFPLAINAVGITPSTSSNIASCSKSLLTFPCSFGWNK